jgi:putative spermidine/putrescine transport system substrate-binding protein
MGLSGLRIFPLLATILVIAMLVAACGSDPTATPTSAAAAVAATPTATLAPGVTPTATAKKSPPTATPTAQISEEMRLSGVTSLADFYEPGGGYSQMEANFDKLYREALGYEDGAIHLWGFSEIDPNAQLAFEGKFPGLTIESQGKQFGTAAAIIQANQAGQHTTETFGGAYTIYGPVHDRDLFNTDFDWTQYGVPGEFTDPARPYMMYDSSNSYALWYNTDLRSGSDIPNDPHDFLDPKWKGKLVTGTSYFFGGFSYIALKFGEEAATELAIKLLDEQDILVTSNPEALLLAGEYEVLFPSFRDMQEHLHGAPLDVKSYEGAGVWSQFAGVMKDAGNVPGAVLFEMWDAYDPDWIETKFKDPDQQQPAVHLGLPQSFFERNIKTVASLNAVNAGDATWLTIERAPERSRLTRVYSSIVRGER